MCLIDLLACRGLEKGEGDRDVGMVSIECQHIPTTALLLLEFYHFLCFTGKVKSDTSTPSEVTCVTGAGFVTSTLVAITSVL